jgi:uncharacterized protein YfaS (alpha-2-macroglobulin family)
VIEGDRFEASTFVHNPGTSPVDVQVRVLIGEREARSERVRLEVGGDARVSVPVDVAAGSERVDVRFEAIAQGATDRRDATVVVRPRGVSQRSWIAGAVNGSRTLDVALPRGAMDRNARFTVTVAPHPFVGLEAAADSLEASPYDNVEALASRVLGLVAYASMATDPARAADARRRGESAVERLLALQNSAGSFGTWTSSDEPWMYGTVYALDALQSAHAAGWRVPTAARERAIESAHQLVLSGSFFDYESATRNDMQAYAVRVLVAAGKPQAPRINALFDQKDQLSMFGRAQLALAMPASDRRRETLCLEVTRRVAEWSRAETRPLRSGANAAPSMSGNRWFESHTRLLASVIRAGAALLPSTSDTRDIASALLRRRVDGAWNDSHETAHALVALSAYAQRFTGRAVPTARVTVDGAVIAAETTANPRARVFSLPVARLVSGSHRVTIEAGEGAFFALDGRWTRALSSDDEQARGREVALHRVIERENGARVESGAHVRAGELLRVRLFVFTERGLPPNVVVRDLIGGGFDAVDRGLDTTPRASLDAILGGSTEDEVVDPRGFHAARSLGYLTHRAFNHGEARFFADRAASGLLEFTYAVRATTPGQFTLPPAQIEAQHDPSFVARTALTSLVVDR